MLHRSVESCSECPLGTTRAGPCPFTPRRFTAGAVVSPQGEVARNVYFVREGTVALSGLGADGSERSLGIRGPRSMLCWEAFQGKSSPVEVRTLTPSRVCALPVAEAANWAGPPDSPARALLSLLVEELVQREEESEARLGDTVGRVARFLLSWSPPGEAPKARLRKQVIARSLGMRPETFSRALTRLVEKGLVSRGPLLTILDREGLEAVASTGAKEDARSVGAEAPARPPGLRAGG